MSRAQSKATDLRGADVDVIPASAEVGGLGTEHPEVAASGAEDLQYTLADHIAAFVGARLPTRGLCIACVSLHWVPSKRWPTRPGAHAKVSARVYDRVYACATKGYLATAAG
jgi:hypothetical protein